MSFESVAAVAVGLMALSFFLILLFSNCITTAPHVEKLCAKKNELDLGDGGGGADAYDDDLNQGWINYECTYGPCVQIRLIN